MRVNKENFVEVFPSIQAAIQKSSFVSFDLEFSGLRFRHQYFPKTCHLESNQSIYERFAYVGQNFLPLQIGISCFYETPLKAGQTQKTYAEETFSFLVHQSDSSSRFVQSDCVNFLSRHKFDFGTTFLTGLPCKHVKGHITDFVLSNSPGTPDSSSTSPNSWITPLADHLKMQESSISSFLIKSSKKQYSRPVMKEASMVVEKVCQWLDTELAHKDQEFIVGSKMVGEAAKELLMSRKFEGLGEVRVGESEVWVHRGEGKQGAGQIEEKSNGEEEEKGNEGERKSLEWLAERYGFSLVFLELVKAKVPMIGHFSIFDWLYLYGACYEPLPKKLTDFLKGLNTIFPTIFDTKCVVSQAKKIDKKLIPGLSAMHQYLKSGVSKDANLIKAAHFDEKLMHDAGYDSSITGFCFIYLTAILSSKKPVASIKKEDFLKSVGKLPEGNLMYLNSERKLDFDFDDDFDGVSSDDKQKAMMIMIDESFSEQSEASVDSLMEEISLAISEQHTYQYSRVHRLCFWTTFKDNKQPNIENIVKEMNFRFTGKATFTDYASSPVLGIERYPILK